ncbi:MAG TPA: hypothetical protein VNL77_00355 [Roseiflexaceae bacterium]|nr:hypothetical protein [Roseiflexaceae bacterium]
MKAHTNYSTAVSQGGRRWFAAAGVIGLVAVVALALLLRVEVPAASMPSAAPAAQPHQAAMPRSFADEAAASPAEYAALGESYLPAQTPTGATWTLPASRFLRDELIGAAYVAIEAAPVQDEPALQLAGPR